MFYKGEVASRYVYKLGWEMLLSRVFLLVQYHLSNTAVNMFSCVW